jgi:hypothetical protein
MITFKINGTPFKIPTSWKDVSYANYIALLDTGNSLKDFIALFTGIDKEILLRAEFRNVEKISLALSFLTVPPQFEAEPTKMVGPYVIPKDVTLESLGQFEDLSGLARKLPKDFASKQNQIAFADLTLQACAVYCQKIKDGEYDYTKVAGMAEELKNYSCIEVIQTGTFFLLKPLNLKRPTPTPSQTIMQRLKKSIQDLPGYQKTLDSLQRSSTPPKQ